MDIFTCIISMIGGYVVRTAHDVEKGGREA